MNKSEVYVIGLMSGTSLDGIDLVYVRFDKSKYSNFNILSAETIPYTSYWKNALQKAIGCNKEQLIVLDKKYGCLLGDTVKEFVAKYKISKIDFIASHGHTVLHQPKVGITLQIGSGQEIARITNAKVICDFRSQDVKLGGQGAPLVPIGDELLFSNYTYCLNLGGFSNVSYNKNGKRIAFDICPVNIVLNHYVSRLGVAYDNEGVFAATGKINEELLEKLNLLSFYKKEPPKSLGLEWVQASVFPLIDELETDTHAILRTFVEHVAIQIAKIIDSDSVLITGGGAFNTFLIQRIEAVANVKVLLLNKQLIDFKEALIFAFLGLLRVDNQVNCLSSVTGAKKDHSSGVIFYP